MGIGSKQNRGCLGVQWVQLPLAVPHVLIYSKKELLVLQCREN